MTAGLFSIQAQEKGKKIRIIPETAFPRQPDTYTRKPHQAWTALPPYTITLSQHPGRSESLPLPSRLPVGPSSALFPRVDPSVAISRTLCAREHDPQRGASCALCRQHPALAEPGERPSPAEKGPPSSVGCREAASCKFRLGLWALPSGDTNTACLLPCPERGFPALF